MTIEETKQIIQKVKNYRPFMQTGNSSREQGEFVMAWHDVLEPYDFADVDRKLLEYFKDGDNIGKIPDVFYLVKYLKTHEDKRNAQGIWVRCQLCQEEMSLSAYEKHYERCASVEYICKQSITEFGQRLNRKQMMGLSQEEFDKRYIGFLERLQAKVKDIDEKNRLGKIIKLLKGENVKITLNEMM